MRRFVACTLVSSLFVTAPLFATPGPETASLSGSASGSSGETLPNVTVQLRNVQTGELAGTTTSSATGSFSFAGLPAGTYTVEVVSAGQIIGTSAAVSVAAGAAVTGIAVSATAAAVAGAAAAGARTAAASTGISTAVIITTIAAGAGIAGAVAVATNGNASPSR